MICYWMMALDIQLCNLSDKAVSKGLFYRSMSYQLVLYHVLVLILEVHSDEDNSTWLLWALYLTV